MGKDIYSITDESIYKREIKKSRFIAYSYKCSDEKQILLKLEGLKKSHHDATHHCWAYVYGFSGEHSRYTDDGEPHGTAGPPILEVIKKKNLTALLVVVIRYYGGTKLGASGLIRAYSDATAKVIDKSGIKILRMTKTLRCTIPYTLLTLFTNLISELKYKELSREFTELVTIVIYVPTEDIETFKNRYNDLTSGKYLFEEIDECYR